MTCTVEALVSLLGKPAHEAARERERIYAELPFCIGQSYGPVERAGCRSFVTRHRDSERYALVGPLGPAPDVYHPDVVPLLAMSALVIGGAFEIQELPSGHRYTAVATATGVQVIGPR